jgi:hypothetical protein
MVITRSDWRRDGDLLQWIALEFPGLTREQFEAAYRLLAVPDLSDEEAEPILFLMRGCQQSNSAARIADNGRGGKEEW